MSRHTRFVGGLMSCSQSRITATDTPANWANNGWLTPSNVRTFFTSVPE